LLARAIAKLGSLLFSGWGRRSVGWSRHALVVDDLAAAAFAGVNRAAAIVTAATLAEQAVALLATTALVAEQAATALFATAATVTATATVTTVAAVKQLLPAAAISSCTTAIAAAAIAAAAAVATEQASVGRFFTADQGDTDDREKNRDAKQNDPIHPKSSKKTYRYRKRTRIFARVAVSEIHCTNQL